jgi:hypothetical protein
MQRLSNHDGLNTIPAKFKHEFQHDRNIKFLNMRCLRLHVKTSRTPFLAFMPLTASYPDLGYLLAGSARQQRAHATLVASGLWPLLAEFGPVLAGTVPLGIDTPASDLDVLCAVPAAAQLRFAALLRAHFGARPGFRLAQRVVSGYATTISGFRYEAEELEIFGQALPTAQQHGWRHLLVEHAVLAAGGDNWRTAMRALKQRGLKTEPAFAHLLGLSGDPYTALLALEDWPADALRQRVAAIVLPNLT